MSDTKFTYDSAMEIKDALEVIHLETTKIRRVVEMEFDRKPEHYDLVEDKLIELEEATGDIFDVFSNEEEFV